MQKQKTENFMWIKFRFRFSLKVNWTLEKCLTKHLSTQEEVILIELIRNYLCLYDKSENSNKEYDVNRNAWSKVAEKLDFIQNGIYKCFYFWVTLVYKIRKR